MAHCLYSVCVKKDSLFTANCADFTNWLNCADFVVSVHYCYKCCIVFNGILNIFRLYESVFVNIKKCDFEALFFEHIQCVKHCVVFKL